jgi:two-component system sensor histidine kinase CpxA
VQREADRLARLVDELIEVTRAEGDPATRNLEELRLDTFIQELADDCKVEAQARGCQLRLDLQRIPILRADRELLRRAVENVLRNGIRHAPEGSEVEVTVAQQNGVASVAIRDHGSGVPDDMLPEIFKPFVRVGEDRSRDSGGVGLGLSIAQRAVALHEGRIWAENCRPGLRVCVELPVR